MKTSFYEYGMIGLGTMGQNLVLNMADNGFSVAGYDKDENKAKQLNAEANGKAVEATTELKDFISSLKTPRVILMLVPAGKIVDSVISDLKQYISAEDLVMDCGNSHFTDTNSRIESLAAEGIHFMGIGVSGGETGARFGPSIMPGGNSSVYKRVEKMLAAIAAKVDNVPCVALMGNGSAGHYVKMVHNGIEYAIMQLISEAYHMLKKIGGLTNEELQEVFKGYDQTAIQSYLIEITAAIFTQKDELSDNMLIDMILDKAHQKGTGAWTSQDSMNLETAVPSIDAAVSQREITTIKETRIKAAEVLKDSHDKIKVEHSGLITLLQDSLHFCMICIYAQGMALIRQASLRYKYDVKLETVATIWRGGCIIRSKMLDDIRAVYKTSPTIENMMLHEIFSEPLNELQKHTRSAIVTAIGAGIPVPAMMASLSYFDSFRSSWLPANLIQAQRDFFGAHTYERLDKSGSFHTEWNTKIN